MYLHVQIFNPCILQTVVMTDQTRSIDDDLEKRKRELTTARARRYREKKRLEAEQLKTSNVNGTQTSENNAQVVKSSQENELQPRRVLRSRKRLQSLDQNSQMPNKTATQDGNLNKKVRVQPARAAAARKNASYKYK